MTMFYDFPTAYSGEFITSREFNELLATLTSCRGLQELRRLWEVALGKPRVTIPLPGTCRWEPDLRRAVLRQLRALRAERWGVPPEFLPLRWKPKAFRQARRVLPALEELAVRLARLPRQAGIPAYLLEAPTASWADRSPVWDLAPRHIYRAVHLYGRRAAFVLAEAVRTVTMLSASQRRRWNFSTGFHFGEAVEAFMPPASIVKKGRSAVIKWQRVLRYVGGSTGHLSGLPYGDVLRLGHLSPFWIQVAYYGCLTAEDSFCRRRVDWAHLAAVMRRQAEPRWDSLTPRGVRQAWTWRKTFGRVPQDPAVFHLPEELILLLRPVWKHFAFLLGLLPQDARLSHTVEAIARLAITFAGRVRQLVEELYPPTTVTHSTPGRQEVWRGEEICGTGAYALILHDAGIELRPPYSKELVEFIWRHRRHGYFAAVRIANSWEALTSLGAHPGMPLKRLKVLADTLEYSAVRHQPFAAECASWGVSQRQFDEFQARWLEGLERLTHESIPWVSVVDGEYRFYRLAKDDPRGVFLGLHTDCCQHPGGAGSTCAWHGHESPDGAFFVVEYRGQVVAQSWAWRRAGVLVLDNIEVLGRDEGRVQVVRRLYQRAAKEILGRLGVTEVRAGVGYTDVPLDDLPQVDPVPAPSGVYSDARCQVLLAKEGKWS